MRTFQKALLWTAVLIGGYIVVVHYKGFGADAKAGGTASKNVIRTLQGR